MYGLEKDKDGGKKKFMFDLELEIRDQPKRGKELLEKAEKRIHDIKKVLREGTNESDFEPWGILLHGYTALQTVLKKAVK